MSVCSCAACEYGVAHISAQIESKHENGFKNEVSEWVCAAREFNTETC